MIKVTSIEGYHKVFRDYTFLVLYNLSASTDLFIWDKLHYEGVDYIYADYKKTKVEEYKELFFYSPCCLKLGEDIEISQQIAEQAAIQLNDILKVFIVKAEKGFINIYHKN